MNRQIAFYNDRKQQMSQDRDGLTMERDVITAYRNSLEQQWKEVLSDLSRLYRANKQLSRQLSARSDDARRPARESVSSR